MMLGEGRNGGFSSSDMMLNLNFAFDISFEAIMLVVGWMCGGLQAKHGVGWPMR